MWRAARALGLPFTEMTDIEIILERAVKALENERYEIAVEYLIDAIRILSRQVTPK